MSNALAYSDLRPAAVSTNLGVIGSFGRIYLSPFAAAHLVSHETPASSVNRSGRRYARSFSASVSEIKRYPRRFNIFTTSEK